MLIFYLSPENKGFSNKIGVSKLTLPRKEGRDQYVEIIIYLFINLGRGKALMAGSDGFLGAHKGIIGLFGATDSSGGSVLFGVGDHSHSGAYPYRAGSDGGEADIIEGIRGKILQIHIIS